MWALGAEGLDHGRHRIEAVDLLDPQLAHVAEDGRALGHRRRHGEGRDLVERRDLRRLDRVACSGPGAARMVTVRPSPGMSVMTAPMR